MKIKLFYLFISIMPLFSCSSDSAETLAEEEEANVETEVILFNYEHDLEANTFVLEYKVKHTNKSSFPVNGFSRVEMGNEGDSFTYVMIRMASEANCSTIAAGEICYDTYYKSGDLGDPQSFPPNGPPVMKLVSASYVVFDE